MVSLKVFACLITIVPVLAHTVPGINSLKNQLAARAAANTIDVVYSDLSAPEIDFINYNLQNLTNYNGTACNKCKNKIKYAKKLITEYPDKQHLVSLLLFKYCIQSNKGDETKCDNIDFFVATNSKDERNFSPASESGVKAVTSIDFYDNDFLHMLKNIKLVDEDLEYYCYFKSKSACPLPALADVEERYNISSWWPEKPLNATQAPVYASAQRETFNVVHFSDFHLQGRYTLGAESNCSVNVCCIPESANSQLNNPAYNFSSYYTSIDPKLSTFAYSFYPDAHYDETNQYIQGEYYDFPKYRGYDFNSAPATTFGSYLCDSPAILLNNSMKYISEAHADKKFEFAIFTGDAVDHDNAHTDAEYTKEEEIATFKIMKHYLDYIPIFPSLGNHDTFPYGQEAPIQYDFNGTYRWNDELMSELWVNNGWLPEANKEQIKSHYSGFSYVTNRGLKIISLNSNCYYQKNLWAYIDVTTNADLFGQWEFLVNELIESEQAGQRVWIMAHIPVADSDALPIQASIFSKIVERFSPYTIANIFWGHTHRDQFHVLYNTNSTKDASDVLNMAWVAQSITPLTNNNPSWRYYEVEDESFNIMNSYNYYTQLNETFTNGGAEPNWAFEYSARDLYDPEQTWPLSAPLNATFWHNFVVEPLSNKTDIKFNQLFSGIQYRHSPFVPKCANGSEVSTTCWNENYCVVANFESTDYSNCLL